jgi:hypothetical protein
MEAWGLSHLHQSPHQSLLTHAQKAVARFNSCQANLQTGSLRIVPLSQTLFAIEGISSKGNRRFLITIDDSGWRLLPHDSSDQFHKRLGNGDEALTHLANAISEAFRVGRVARIPTDQANALREELSPKPIVLRGDDAQPIERDSEIVIAWMTVDSILQSPASTKHAERAILDAHGKVTSHLLITYQEPKKRFIMERLPFPRPFDSRPSESITLTKDTISHFDPDGPEPFSSKERSLDVFREWMGLWEKQKGAA